MNRWRHAKYRVLLVDDDPTICMGLKKLINWRECGFEVAGIAGNGEEVIILHEKNNYNLIITDIKMPVMNGLELIGRLHDMIRSVQVIIVSAYGEFSYAQKVMRYGVNYYLLKPVEETVLEGYLSHIKEMLDANKTRTQSEVQRKDQIESQYRIASNGIIPEIKNYINQHYRGQLSVNMLAEIYSFSPAYLGRIFKKHTGEFFNEYLKKVRIQAACDLLDSDPGITVNELSGEVGFNDINYFYRLFKQVTGFTPNQYRQH